MSNGWNIHASLPCIAGKIKRFAMARFISVKLLFTSCRTYIQASYYAI
jgi:hypothetical protein